MSRSARDGFGRHTTADEVVEGIDLSGRLALVTGASGGLGAETARALASKGARMVLTARDLAKGETVAKGIREATGNAEVEVEELELDSLGSIRRFGERFLARHDALQILVNNAGVMACPQAKTADGFELELERRRKRASRGGGRLTTKTVEAGAATSVYAATAPELEGRGGLYLEDCGVAEVDDAEDAAAGVRSYALDPEFARRLWAVSEEIMGQSIPL